MGQVPSGDGSRVSGVLSSQVVGEVRRRPWGTRRRTRSTGSLPFSSYQKASDDSSSSVGERVHIKDKGRLSSLHQSDSDDVSTMPGKFFSLQSRHVHSHLLGNMESDSVNENFSPIRPKTRSRSRVFPWKILKMKLKPVRKHKFKRMAVDVEMASSSRPSVVTCVPSSFSAASKKKRILRHNVDCENRFCGCVDIATGCNGKRKRNNRVDIHRKMEIEPPLRGLGLNRLSLKEEFQSPAATGDANNFIMDTCMPVPLTATPAPSSSSLSSSESDTGIFTNDEGREGDDEQSDWFGDVGGAVGGSHCGTLEELDQDEDMDSTFQAILQTSNILPINEALNKSVTSEFLRRGGREIRGGRRRIRGEKPSFSILTSANEKLSQFLQDPAQSELRLHPMHKNERDQLGYLAELYSLKMKLTETSHEGLTCPILTKTSNTVRVERLSLGRLHKLSDFKRRRNIPPNDNILVPESNGVCETSQKCTHFPRGGHSSKYRLVLSSPQPSISGTTINQPHSITFSSTVNSHSMSNQSDLNRLHTVCRPGFGHKSS